MRPHLTATSHFATSGLPVCLVIQCASMRSFLMRMAFHEDLRVPQKKRVFFSFQTCTSSPFSFFAMLTCIKTVASSSGSITVECSAANAAFVVVKGIVVFATVH